MERDFMGLNPVKEDVSDGLNDSALAKAQWSFGNKVSAVLSHISAQEHTPNKTASFGFSQNLAGFLMKQSLSAASIAGLANSRNKVAGSPAQMTIFFNGTVRVYDSITPEKAQAIMFLAENASCLFTSDARAGTQVRPPTPKFDANDAVPVNGSSHNGAQSVSGSTRTDELVTNKLTLSPFSPECKMDHPKKPMAAFGSAAAPSNVPLRGIPQFPKVSLARFLEKRKERAMNAAPYNAAKKPECAS